MHYSDLVRFTYYHTELPVSLLTLMLLLEGLHMNGKLTETQNRYIKNEVIQENTHSERNVLDLVFCHPVYA